MTTFAEHQNQHRRLDLLRGLAAAAGYRANVVLLVNYLTAVGYAPSHDTVAADLAWLRDAGLAALHDDAGAPVVAELTVRGLDVAAGRTQVPGVARPQPGG